MNGEIMSIEKIKRIKNIEEKYKKLKTELELYKDNMTYKEIKLEKIEECLNEWKKQVYTGEAEAIINDINKILQEE